MNNINLVATSIDPDKMYLITPKEKMSPSMADEVFKLLKRGEIRCVFLNIPMDIVPADRVDKVVIE
jgi:hypothetical protein